MKRRAVLAAALAAAMLAGCPQRTPTEQPTGVPPRAMPDGGVAPTPDGGAIAVTPPIPVAPKPKQRPPKIKIIVRSTPKAMVSWGKEQLGWTPVTLERPRDSGPVDLVLRADGYLPVHTRAYTFRNDAVGVRLTKLADKGNILGAKKEPPVSGVEPSEGSTPPAPRPGEASSAPPIGAPAPPANGTPPPAQ